MISHQNITVIQQSIKRTKIFWLRRVCISTFFVGEVDGMKNGI